MPAGFVKRRKYSCHFRSMGAIWHMRTAAAATLLLATLVLMPGIRCAKFGEFWQDPQKNVTADTVVPTSPTTFAAVQGGSTQINLTWGASTDETTVQSAIVYEICQGTLAGFCNTFTATYTTAAGATAFAATGLTPSTPYFFRVRARDLAGNLSTPTAEATATTAAPGVVNSPVFSPLAGTYNASQNITITSSTGGATICYAFDPQTPACDTTPVCTTGTQYGGPVAVSTTNTLRAIACLAGNTDSSVTSGAYTIDTLPPNVLIVTSSTPDGTYGAGANVSIQITFDEVVNVTGTPQLQLATTSPALTAANYTSGSGTTTLTFTYTVAAGNSTIDLDYDSTGALGLNGGTISDPAGNAATLTLPVPGVGSSLGGSKAIVIDGTAPAVTNVTAANADSTYGVGAAIVLQVQFNEPVTVTGSPTLDLATGSPAVTALNYSSGSGSNTLVFNYNVVAGNSSSDLDYASTAALNLNGGTIRDASLNNAVLTLPAPGTAGSLGANKAIVIDGSIPSVTGVTASVADALYGTGSVIGIRVLFSENVFVGGTPQLTLATGSPATTVINYVSGSGTSMLDFQYTVASGNNSGDLDYTNTAALSLNGGSIQDAAGNQAVLTLFAPGAAGSLGGNRSIVIDGVAPMIISAQTLDLNRNGKIDAYRITFNEPVLDSTFPGFITNALGSVTTAWPIAGYTGVRLVHGTQVATLSSGLFTDTPNDPVVYVAFAETVLDCTSSSQTGCDTGTTPDITMNTADLTDMANNLLTVFGSGSVIENDNAPPIVVYATAISSTLVELVLSESILAPSAECGPGSSQPGINCTTRYTGNNSLTISSAIMTSGAGVNGNRVELTTSSQGWMIAYTLTITSGIVQDLATRALVAPSNVANFNGSL